MRKLLYTIGMLLVLGACSSEKTYDVEVSCIHANFKENNDDGTTRIVSCSFPYFQIQCMSNTVQEWANSRLCKTHDGQRVQILLEAP